MYNFDKSKWKLDPSDFEININKSEIKSCNFCCSFYIQKSTGINCIIKRTRETLNNIFVKKVLILLSICLR